MKSDLALRVYIPQKPSQEFTREVSYDRIFVFDTETTTDEYQNLKIGSFIVYDTQETILNRGIFYDSRHLKNRELRTIKSYCSKNGIPCYQIKDFIEKVFYPDVYYNKALCVGFNLPFDLSRLAISFNSSRRKMKGGFSLRLSKNTKYPLIRIRHVHSKLSFIRFGSGLDASGQINNFDGYFLDLHTTSFSLTNKDYSLKSVCEKFNTQHKKLDADHGFVTEKYLDYNINDTLATYELYLKLKEEYEKYQLALPITQVYSPASIGKACLKKLGIRPFLEQNPDFPNDIIGHVMTTYYGGRSEVKIRKKPTKIVLMDFLSMYPTVCTLQRLWDFIIADKIRYYDDTENVRKLVKSVKLDDIQNKRSWKLLTAIVQIKPDNDILPVRCRYENKNTYNIGINYVTSEKTLWYTLSDILASKLLTGKSPEIIRAIRFEPVGQQKTLVKAEIAGLVIDPRKDDLFQKLIEKRLESKDEGIRQILKTIANATSYGIFIEINTENKKQTIDVFGLETLRVEVAKEENCGHYFNPIIAIFITSAARLILASVEAKLDSHGSVHAFCDTDSMAVPKDYYKEIQNFFKPLNPYNFDKPLFKIEKENYGSDGNLKNLWFYGISAKRYVLYNIEHGKILIRKHSSHGLGHIMNPFGIEDWEKNFWMDILLLHYGKITSEDMTEKYSSLYSISRMVVNSPFILKRFSKLRKHIRPFNFILVGVGNKLNESNSDVVKPVSAFTKDAQKVVHNRFVDYKTGKIMKGIEYWKPMDIVFDEYIKHKEAKFDGDNGELVRKHIQADGVIYIGKESTNLDETGILTAPEYTKYNNSDEFIDKLLHLTPKQAKAIGIQRNTLWHMKKHASTGNLNLSKKIKRRLMSTMEVI